MCAAVLLSYIIFTPKLIIYPPFYHACSKKFLKAWFFLSLWVKVSLFFSTENFYIIVDMMGKYSLRFFWHSFVLKVRMSKSDKRKWLALFHTHIDWSLSFILQNVYFLVWIVEYTELSLIPEKKVIDLARF